MPEKLMQQTGRFLLEIENDGGGGRLKKVEAPYSSTSDDDLLIYQ